MEPMRNLDKWHTYKWDDDNPNKYGREGYCYIQPADTFKDGRYVAQKKLGWDINATFWLAWDTLHSQYVTLKVRISAGCSTARAQFEIDTLEKIASKDQENQTCFVKLLDHFIHRARYCSHVCMVFEYLGDNLIKLIKCYGPKGLPLRLVKHICLHILECLDYLHTEFSLIHGDIQPENICLISTIDPSDDPRKSGASPNLPPKKSNDEEETSKIVESCTSSLGQLVLSHDVESRKSHDDLMGNPDVNSVESRKNHDILVGSPDVNSAESSKSHVLMGNQKELLESLDHRCKLVDLGYACSPGKGHHFSVRTMPYRPPEVIFVDKPYISASADIWSFACVCFELATGQYLFPAQYGDDYCRDEDHLALMKQHLDRIPPAMIARGVSCSEKWFDCKGRLRNVPTRKRRTIKERLVEDYNFNEKDATELGDFLNWILKYEPTERPTAAKCRRHKWFNDVKDDHVIPTSGRREETKLKNVNVVDDEHFISESKENGAREKTKLKNVNVVEDEDEHFTSKSKKNLDYNCKREKTESKKKNGSSSGRRKKAVMETTNAKAKSCRDRRPNPS